MRTKKGDWVRVCFGKSNEPEQDYGFLGTWISYDRYRVISICNPNRVIVMIPGGIPFETTSWVRCADLKEGGK